MKATPHTLISLCLIIFSIYTNSLRCEAAEEAVIDMDGEDLRVGIEYYMVTNTWNIPGGGVTLHSIGNPRCPDTVGLVPTNVGLGLPLSFHPVSSEESVVRVSTNANIKFEVPVPCATSTVWRVGRLNPWARTNLIEIGGEQGNPGCDTASSLFKFEKVPEATHFYNVVFDPSDVCNISTPASNVATLTYWNGRSILALSGTQSRPFAFVKARPLKQA